MSQATELQSERDRIVEHLYARGYEVQQSSDEKFHVYYPCQGKHLEVGVFYRGADRWVAENPVASVESENLVNWLHFLILSVVYKVSDSGYRRAA